MRAKVIYVVRSPERRDSVACLLAGSPCWCATSNTLEQITRLQDELTQAGHRFHGLVPLDRLRRLFRRAQALSRNRGARSSWRAVDISCYSLLALSQAFRPLLDPDALGRRPVDFDHAYGQRKNYGYMAPIKAALDSSLAFLAKSFSRFSRIPSMPSARGLLKTSASAGTAFLGYVDSYLYAEQVIPRKAAVTTAEAAQVALFLLSPRSSGINAR
ncbi:MAG: SDR family oxidoreductase [Pirellulales bacterium]